MKQAAIVGAGLIGRAWANVFARAGWNVRVWDPDEGQRRQAAKLVAQSLHELAAFGLVDAPEAAERRVAVVATTLSVPERSCSGPGLVASSVVGTTEDDAALGTARSLSRSLSRSSRSPALSRRTRPGTRSPRTSTTP